MWAFCLYGVNDCDFERNTFQSEDLKFYKNGIVPKEYFQKLSLYVSKEVDDLPPVDKPVLLMIEPKNPHSRNEGEDCPSTTLRNQ